MAKQATKSIADELAALETIKVLNEVYFVNDSNEAIRFETKVGAPGQTSKTDATLTDAAHNHTALATGHSGSIPEMVIGKNKNLDGFVLTVTCMVTATADDTTFCEELVLLKGGVKDEKYRLCETVEEKGKSTLPPFSLVVTFLKI